jgi:uncharacterized integral membrane protein
VTFSPGWYKLSPPWHLLAALVLSCVIVGLGAEVAVPYGAMAQTTNQGAWETAYFVCLVVGFTASMLLMLPRTSNAARVTFVRSLGKFSLPVRYGIALAFTFGLCGLLTLVRAALL